MLGLEVTAHAAERLRQRGHRERDLELVAGYGTPTAGGCVLTRADADRAIAACHRMIRDLDRLAGTAIFTTGPVVKTIYRPKASQLHGMLSDKPRKPRVRRKARACRKAQAGRAGRRWRQAR